MSQARDEAVHWVYFMRSTEGGPIKIGRTQGDPEKRLRYLQTNSPFPLICIGLVAGGKGLEAEMHQRFAEARLHGEWFRPTPDLLEYIKALDPTPALPSISYPEISDQQIAGLPDCLTVPEAAAFLRISRMHAYESVRDGTIPSFRIGSRILVLKEALLEKMRSGSSH